jgi:Tfp pilus assembly PilM family ATPase
MFLKNILKHFPPPQYLEMPSVGFAINDHSVRYMGLSQGRKCVKIKSYGEKAIPQDVVENGFIKNPQALVEVLKSIKKEQGFTFIRASLPEEKGYLFKISAPIGNDEEIREYLEFKLEENVPVKPAEAVFDFEIIDTKDDTNVLMVTVFPEKVIEAYVDVYHEAGLTPISFENEGRAMTRSIIEKGRKGTYLIVNISNSTTSVAIVCNGFVRFTSTISSGLDKNFSKESFSLLKDEIGKIIIYWQTHSEKHKEITSIILCGIGSVSEGFDSFLSISLKMNVEMGNVWTNAIHFESCIPEISLEDSLKYAVPIGLALETYV